MPPYTARAGVARQNRHCKDEEGDLYNLDEEMRP